MTREHDDIMFEMQRTINDQGDEIRWLSRTLRDLTGELWDLRRQLPVRPPVVIDLTVDDEEGIVVGENEEPLMVRTVVRVERADTVVPDSEAGTLVEVEDGQSTPQIIGEAERLFERMEWQGSVEQRVYDEEADYVALAGVAPEYEDAPSYS